MKTSKIITVLLLLVSVNFYAQGEKRDKKEEKEKIKAMKVAFFTTELSLTTTEAEKFWPIYNAFEDKQFENRSHKMRSIKSKLETIEAIDEKEAQSLLSQFENVEEDLHQNRKKLVQNLRAILPATKILRLKKAEDDFNRKLLKQYKGNRAGKP